MYFDADKFQSSGPEVVAEALRKGGALLRGKNLSNESWLEIALGLRQVGIARVVLPRLRRATCRDDVLWVLRMVRQRGPTRGRRRPAGGSRSAGRARRQPDWAVQDVGQVALNADNAAHDFDLLRDAWEEHHRYWSGSPFDYRIWQAWDLITGGAEVSRSRTLSDSIPDAVWRSLSILVRGSTPEVHESEEPAPCCRDLELQPLPAAAWFDTLQSLFRGGFVAHSELSRGSPARPLCRHDVEILAGVVGSSDHCTDVADPQVHGPVLFACLLSPFWIRSAASWCKPPGDRPTVTRSLIDHLFVKYPVPPVMYNAWNLHGRRQGFPDEKSVVCFMMLAQGLNLRRAGVPFGWRFPKGFVDWLWKAPVDYAVETAFLWAHVRRMGGSLVDFARLRRERAMRIDPTGNAGLFPDEVAQYAESNVRYVRFLSDTVAWMARYRHEVPDAVWPEVLAWAVHEYLDGGHRGPHNFSWSGRIPRAVVAAAHDYASAPKQRQRQWVWSSHGWDWQMHGDPPAWSIHELLSSEALLQEGQALAHCVADYDLPCLQGTSAIFSLHHHGQRALTVEITVQTRQITRALGLQNRSAEPRERAVLERWLKEIVLR